MRNLITAHIFRFDSQNDAEPYYKDYRINAEEKISALSLLSHIQEELDSTLSFRNYCCGLQTCRSCLMRINHKRRFACLTLVSPGEEVVFEPLTYPDSHIKDLVVKQDPEG
ncbi:2Fe-2S iron-sulfur cluster-binding protein [Chloroflexota bacterium]